MVAVLSPTVSNLINQHRVSVEEFRRMGEREVFERDVRMELIDGVIVNMTPPGPAHIRYVNRLTRALSRAVQDDAVVSVQNSIALPPHSQPQPDVVLLKPATLMDDDTVPQVSEVLLAVEVSDTSLTYDRDVKARLYAQHGVPELWILDVQGRQLLICRGPAGSGYADVQMLGPSGEVAPQLLPQASVDLVAIFG